MKYITVLLCLIFVSNCSSIDISGLYDDAISSVMGSTEKDPGRLGKLKHSYKAGDNLVCVFEYGTKISDDQTGGAR